MRIVLMVIAMLSTYCLRAQNVGINNKGAAADAKAMLDISSNTKGVLIPRMTQGERDAIGTPPQGLLVFNTNANSFQYYNGALWNNLTHSGIVTGAPNKVPRFLGIWGLTPGVLTDDGNGVSINNTSAVANASALLDMTSTTKGLLVFDTNLNAFMFYDGTDWGNINGNGASEWNVNGNDIYNNNNNSGNMGIGVSTPTVRLAVDSPNPVNYNITWNCMAIGN